MSIIHLIRHGQANSQGENYDLLTSLGKNQSFALGKYMAYNGELPDRIVTGTLRRHLETADWFMKGVVSEVGDLEKYKTDSFVCRDSGWNEFSPELWNSLAKLLVSDKPEFARILSQFYKVKTRGGIRSAALFYKLTEEILKFWRENAIEADGIETYENFETRIFHSYNVLFSSGEQERIFLFTSGTPISLVLNHILRQEGAPFSWMPWIWNTSVSTFRKVKGEYLPISVNGVPHLTQKTDRTLF
ncbi:histidine phosphatase family protein [Leptospira kirschneri]|uniref:histidine phosphatase family protein n=1 Tax=Leptospira kirschneri TaxID=29507 RepID=UPI000297D280|nr:histidine phosphatase family protein [Leptospira kirschneri]EKQ83206.1 histidine phosphatase superfamily (branch 1) [Leptospira kirschneri serovar Grippotyphosa str. Moskva]OOV49966.1 histidine phosphatase family protein [Leptospira kirschneri serovar Grippotyphosa]